MKPSESDYEDKYISGMGWRPKMQRATQVARRVPQTGDTKQWRHYLERPIGRKMPKNGEILDWIYYLESKCYARGSEDYDSDEYYNTK